MDAMNTFSLICLVFGLLCAVVALRAYFVEMRDINQAAAMRRVEFPIGRPVGRRLIFQEDGKPLCWEDDEQ